MNLYIAVVLGAGCCHSLRGMGCCCWAILRKVGVGRGLAEVDVRDVRMYNVYIIICSVAARLSLVSAIATREFWWMADPLVL